MKTKILALAVLVSAVLLPEVQADIDFMFTVKISGYDQVGNATPTGPLEWNFAAGVNGNELVTGASLTYPGSNSPVLLLDSNGNYETPEQDFFSQASLDAAYPDGSYSFAVTDNGLPSLHGPYALGGGSPPNQPYFTNFSSLQAVDPSKPLSLEWAPFNSPPQDAFIELSIDGAPGYSDLKMDLGGISSGDTSVIIPANTLEPKSKYSVPLFFVSPSQTGDTPKVLAGYESYVGATILTTSPTVGPNPADHLTGQIQGPSSVRLDWNDNSDNETGFRIERKLSWERTDLKVSLLLRFLRSLIDQTISLNPLGEKHKKAGF